MAEKRAIHEFQTATAAALSALLVDSVDDSATSGYTTEKLLLSDLANFVGGGINYTQQLTTTSKSLFGAINELKTALDSISYIEISDTLETGETELVIQDENITEESTIDIYSDVYGINPKNVIVTDGSITLVFDAMETDINIKVRVS